MSWDRRRILQGIGLGAAASLPACANGDIIGLDRAALSLDIANGGEPLSLDPHKASGVWENNVIGNIFMGLTTEDKNGQPIPGMAERWDVSADGLTWLFYLRPMTWSDGEACDAHDLEFAFQRMLDPASLAEYAPMLYPVLNAEDVNKGHLPVSAVGATALDDRTFEIRLEHPTPYLPQVLKHYTAYPVPKHKVTAFGDAWIHPRNVVSNGPYLLEKWWSNYIIHLKRNPRFFDARDVLFKDLYFYPSTDPNAAARSVQSGERGWSTNFPSNQVHDLRRRLPGYVRAAPYLLSSFFSFNMTRPPFNDRRVRRALTMAYDRDFVASQILRTGERPAYSITPPGIANYVTGQRYDWADRPIAQRKQEAQRLLREAGYGPNNPLRVEFSHRNTSDNPRIAVVVQSDWRSIAPWVEVNLHGAEVQVHYANLKAKNYQVGDGGWVADYNDARTYLFLLETRTGAQNYPGYSNPEFDRLMAESDVQADALARAHLMARAEQIALDDAPFCMSTFGVSKNLVHPDITGYENNMEDIHRARWFGLR
jgi:oligopeptide transport system substrate-binding protein